MIGTTTATEYTLKPLQHSRLRHLVQRWVSTIAPTALAKGLRISASIDPAIPEHILIEPEALTTIVDELLSNAIRFTNAGDVTLSIDHRGDAMALTIRDTGIGMPSYLTASLLRGTVQTRPLSHRARDARPSGLDLVQRLTRLLGGSVILYSRLGEGTAVTVLLPLMTDTAHPTRS
jgi:signal transduction histidine kinase